ncbi:MAG: ABC transporter substrate-binding protein [Rhodocyclaceae bacterium]|nr:ABC transporter substrate-binding protein [Rhodocyclaceae bacterium]MDZ4213845.1 ABC transporter substrate-binding protein [Rhodocyclaceae bacterium]
MKHWLAALAVFVFAIGGVSAQEKAPDVLVKDVTNEVLEIVRSDKDIRNGNTRKTIDLVESKVLPHFNFQRMTQLALGKEARKASPEQMAVLVNEFRALLVRTYSSALTQYRTQEVVFKPFKPDATRPDDAVVVCQIKQSGGKPIDLVYNLEKTASGWKVYDMIVGGVSLVTNYRSSFSQEIQGNGMDGLISSLQAKNKSAETRQQSK